MLYPPPRSITCQQQSKLFTVPEILRRAEQRQLILTQHTCTKYAMHAPHTSTSDHVVLSSRPLHPPPPLMWDTLESRENSPGERKRVDLRSSLGRGLPLIPVASRAPLWPPTVAFNHLLHHPLPAPPASLHQHPSEPSLSSL